MSEINITKGYEEPSSYSKACEQEEVGPTQWFCDTYRYSKEIPWNTQTFFFFLTMLLTYSF